MGPRWLKLRRPMGEATGERRGGVPSLGAGSQATFAFLAAMTVYLCFHRLALPEPLGMYGLHDLGWLSWYTMVLQATSLALLVRQIRKASSARGRAALLALSYMALIYLLREADFHRLFTDEHVTRVRFYFDSSVSAVQRLLAALVMLPFFACAVGMAVRSTLPILRAPRAGMPWAVSLTLWGAALVGSQVADQTMSGYTAKLLEEGLEATAAGLALLTVLHARARPASLLAYTGRGRAL
jgi:hypothetical protein